MITSRHSKTSNPSGFNPILQKIYKMICEIVVSKTVCGIFLIFCRSSFINSFMVKNSFSQPKNQRELNISKPVYFKNVSAHRFVGLICTSKLEAFIFGKNFFSRTCSFFHDCNTTNLSIIFFHKKIILYFFSRVIIWFQDNIKNIL